jgi:hypothetical protein
MAQARWQASTVRFIMPTVQRADPGRVPAPQISYCDTEEAVPSDIRAARRIPAKVKSERVPHGDPDDRLGKSNYFATLEDMTSVLEGCGYTIVRTIAEGDSIRDWSEINRSGQLSSRLNQPSVTRRR